MNNQVNEILHKEIDIIQECIERMADCSFKLKGWYISLVTLALTLLIGQGCKLSIVALFLFCGNYGVLGNGWFLLEN